MNKFILTALVLSTTLTAFITPAQATQTHTDAVIGTVSATASTLTELENLLQDKAIRLGGNHYTITSARMGNRTTGTAIVYK